MSIMDCGEFLKQAREKGFDTVAALGLDEVEAATDTWRKHLRDGDYQGFLLTDPREILPTAACVLVFAYPYRTYEGYPDGVGRVSGYYFASNSAFHALGELTEELQRQGVSAVHTHKLPLKPLAAAAGLGRYGRNGVIVRSGSHIVLGSIVVSVDLTAQFPHAAAPVPDCEKCKACEAACPTGCLSDGFVNADRCLRSYMTHNIGSIPDDLRARLGERLLGCDECLNACPGHKREAVPQEYSALFSWEALNNKDTFNKNKKAVAKLIGSNNVNALQKFADFRK